MYTKCPECDVAFRITAAVLQQASGRVRCGSCGSAFNALDHLHEEPPDTAGAGTDGESTDRTSSRDLLDTLDRLTGPEDVRIEDTGVEWLVLDDADDDGSEVEGSWNVEDGRSGISAADAELDTAETSEQPALDEQAALESGATPPQEMRYDDNTPLPDDFGEEEYRPPPATPQRRAEDHAALAETDEAQSELELSEPDEWKGLLDEVGDALPGNDDSAAGDLPLEIEEELAAIHDELSALPESLIDKAVEVVDEITRTEPALAGEEAPPAEEIAPPVDEDPLPAEDEQPAVADETPVDEEAPPEAVDKAELTVDDVLQLEEEDAEKGGEAAAEDVDPAEMLDADDLDALAEETGSNEQVDADEQPKVEYEETTGEFERAIQGAEDAILAERAEDDAANTADEEEAPEAVSDAEQPDQEETAGKLSLVEDDDIAAMTANMQIDDELLKAMKDKDLAAAMAGEDGQPVVETIVMEGDAVRGMHDIEDEHEEDASEPAATPMPREPIRDPGSLVDTYMMSRADDGRRGWLGGKTSALLIVLLVLGLAGQYIHTSREYLATFGFFNQTIGPVYRMFGEPVTPRWDIKGWQFEATNGSTNTDNEVLTISSRISNRSQQSLPYPLVHVSLTDRYEEIIGSRVLEPDEYLAGNADPSRPVAAGANFSAVITIASPSPEATGFKLNVCYRVAPGQVRCAIEDFKAP